MMKWLFFIGLLIASMPCLAIEEQPIYETETFTIDEIKSQIKNFTKTPKGGIAWELFAKTKDDVYTTIIDGEEWEGIKPKFTEQIKQLDGQSIKMSGYMFPLDQTKGQSHFLFGPFPLSCPYHYHAPNSLTIEVHADKTIPFSYDSIIVEGTLELVSEDYEYNTFYRLRDARLVQ